jgi:hypothetical protein
MEETETGFSVVLLDWQGTLLHDGATRFYQDPRQCDHHWTGWAERSQTLATL